MRVEGEPIGHVTTGEYGSQMLSWAASIISPAAARRKGVTCDALLKLCNGEAVEMAVDEGRHFVVQAGKPPIVNNHREERMRVGCGSATIGMFAKQWYGKVDEVVVVDDHITGVLSEHQAGKVLGAKDTGIRMRGRKSTPGRYFHVAEPGSGWGGTNVSDPLQIIEDSTQDRLAGFADADGEHHRRAACLLRTRPGPEAGRKGFCRRTLRSVERIAENCEPALSTVLFMGGAGGRLRAGSRKSRRLTRSVKDALTVVTPAAPVYVWPGGGITFMVG